MADELAVRSVEIAARAVASLPRPLGYLGVDLVLGSDPRGAEDTVIEINPRLTTSYVGLRALCQANLAQAMIDVASGREVELCWQARSLQFDSAGNLEAAPFVSVCERGAWLTARHGLAKPAAHGSSWQSQWQTGWAGGADSTRVGLAERVALEIGREGS